MDNEAHPYSDAARQAIVRRFYEPQLAALELTEAQLAVQSPAELARSLQRLEEALAHPEGFGVLRLKLTTQGYVVALTNSAYHYETTITPLLLERQQWILAHFQPAPAAAPEEPLADLELHVLPRSGESYPVDLTLNDEQVWRGRLAAEITPWQPSGDLNADGRRLFAQLCADPALARGWAEARGLAPEHRLRLWLDVDEPALHTLPWELLYDDTPLAADARTPFSRYLPVDKPWGAAVTERPLCALAVLANPGDLAGYGLARLDVAAERALLAEAFQSVGPEVVTLEFLEPPVTLARLEARLQAQPCHILHYLGHSAFNARRDQGVLYLEDAAGQTQLARDDALAGMLDRLYTPPRLVFLAACQSGACSLRATLAGLAPQLVRAGLPAVVAMQDTVTVAAANACCAAFYPPLLRHGVVDRALNEARSTLLTAGSLAAAAPALWLRLRAGRLF